jgi:hypothetical protein
VAEKLLVAQQRLGSMELARDYFPFYERHIEKRFALLYDMQSSRRLLNTLSNDRSISETLVDFDVSHTTRTERR